MTLRRELDGLTMYVVVIPADAFAATASAAAAADAGGGGGDVVAAAREPVVLMMTVLLTDACLHWKCGYNYVSCGALVCVVSAADWLLDWPDGWLACLMTGWLGMAGSGTFRQTQISLLGCSLNQVPVRLVYPRVLTKI